MDKQIHERQQCNSTQKNYIAQKIAAVSIHLKHSTHLKIAFHLYLYYKITHAVNKTDVISTVPL